MATNIEATTVGTTRKSVSQARQFQGLFDVILVKVPLTDASVAAQVATQGSVTVPGVRLGDFVLVSTGADNLGLIVSAHVSATDTIKFTAFNVEGTDAVTALSAGATANLLVLRPKANSPWSSV